MSSLALKFVPIARLWLRYAPVAAGKSWLWSKVWWRYRRYEARIASGHRVVGHTEDVIQRHLYYFGVWEPDITEFIRRRIRPGDVIVDVGANIGYYTLLASKLVGTEGSVVAIEACPPIYDKLVANIQRNAIRNARTLLMAATDRTGDISIRLSGPGNLGQSSTVVTPEHARETYTVKGCALSEVLTANELSRTRLFKIDTEGAELGVIRGLAKVFSSLREDAEFLLEVSPDMTPHLQDEVREIFAFFRERGFFSYAIHPVPHSLGNTGRVVTPKRIDEVPDTQTDVVFSRTDAEFI